MDFSGHFDSLMVDLLAGKQKAVLMLNEDARGAFDSLKDFPLSITIKKYRKKRSLNANAYFHVLVGKLADTLGTSKAYMKNTLLQKYGQLAIENDSIVPLIIRDDIDMMEREEIHVRPTDKTRIMDDGKAYRVYLLLRGSHTYNTAEMSSLIDGTVQDAKEQGIETATPDELERMKQQWRVEA